MVRANTLALLVVVACSSPAPVAGTGTTDTDGASGECGQCGAAALCDPVLGRCVCDPMHHGDAELGCEPTDACAEAERRLGHVACAEQITDESAWLAHSVGGGRADTRRLGKYLLPADADARLPPLFNNANRYALHYCLMSVAFEPDFPGLTPADYAALILPRDFREFYAGSVYELTEPTDTGQRFAFTLETLNSEAELPVRDDVRWVWRHLQDRFAPGELAFYPFGPAQQERARSWQSSTVPLAWPGESAPSYEAYNAGVAFGRIRLVSADDPEPPVGLQDIAVFDAVPGQFEGIVAGVITGGRQDVLGHLNVLAARRGTVNAYVDDAHAAFAIHDGELVRLHVLLGRTRVQPATLDEAEAFWEMQRPEPVTVPPPDLTSDVRVGINAPVEDSPSARGALRSRIGGKATALNVLYQTLPSEHQVAGFALPFSHYRRFVNTATWRPEGLEEETFSATLERWLADPEFLSDTSVRRRRLAELRTAMRDATDIDSATMDELRDGIASTFAAGEMVRMRSSSNAEDGLVFNGAGLYDSTNGCLADSDDSDEVGPSVCDPEIANERPLERGLLRVWSSLWNFGAFEERSYYGIDHRNAAMAVLVNTRFGDEQANGVAFTGSVSDADDDRYLINVQHGDTNVVDAAAGVTAELVRVTMDGLEVKSIERLRRSSLIPDTDVVLEDTQIRQLVEQMATTAQSYPVDGDDGLTYRLDLEFKFDASGRLVIKQIRPFLPRPSDDLGGECLLP